MIRREKKRERERERERKRERKREVWVWMNFAWCVLGWLFKVPVRKWPAAPRFCTQCSCRNMITRSEGKQSLTRRGIKQKYLVTNWITLALSVKMKIDHRDYDGSQEVNIGWDYFCPLKYIKPCSYLFQVLYFEGRKGRHFEL